MSIFSRKASVSNLRAAISTAIHSDALHEMPDRIAGLITAFDHINVHPDLRADVMHILNAAVNLAHSMMEHTYPAQLALAEVTNLMAMLPRVIQHLTTRPTTAGFAIMMPSTKAIFPQVFTTEGEAHDQLQRLQALGASRTALVVPVQITSDHVVQPQAVQMDPLAPRAFASQIPVGIRPAPAPTAPQMDPFALQAHLDHLEDQVAEFEELGSAGAAAPPTLEAPVENAPNLPTDGDLPRPVGPPTPTNETAPAAPGSAAIANPPGAPAPQGAPSP